MFDKVIIRGIALQAVKNREIFANWLMNEKRIQFGRLVAINAESDSVGKKSVVTPSDR